MPNPNVSLIDGTLKNRLYLIIGQSCVRADQRAVDMEIGSIANLVDDDFGYHRSAVLIRAKRA